MSFILNHLRTAPPPVPNPARPLVPGSPAPTHLPLDPIGYLTVAIDSVAPLLRIRSQRGAAGGGAALQIPVPLGLRQRRRQAVQWILDAANKKKSRGSGRNQFALRFADELINVVEGKSSVWEKRQVVHKTGTSARANLSYRPGGRRWCMLMLTVWYCTQIYGKPANATTLDSSTLLRWMFRSVSHGQREGIRKWDPGFNYGHIRSVQAGTLKQFQVQLATF